MQFDQFAADYKQILDQTVAASGEGSAYFAEYKARYLARVLPSNFSGKVLDFGCGVGLLSGFLAKHLPAARVDGFDVSRDSIRQVDPGLARKGLFTADLDLLTQDYSLIVVANVMHHISPARRLETVKGLTDRLAPGRWLAVFEHNPRNPLTRWVVERCPFDKDAVLLSPAEIAGYFAGGGLRILRRDYIVFLPRFVSWLRPFEPWLAWLPLGAQYSLIGEKNA